MEIQSFGAATILDELMMFKQDDRPGPMPEMLLQDRFTSNRAMLFCDNTR